MGRFFINCDDASILSTRAHYNDLNSKERFRHNLHKSHCLKCRDFHKKNARFQRGIDKLKWVKLTAEEKDRIRQRLLQAMKK